MTKKSLFPVPKILLPALVIWIGIAAKWIATGDFNREEAAIGFTTLAYAAIGWTTPQNYGDVPVIGAAIEKRVGVPKRKRQRKS